MARRNLNYFLIKTARISGWLLLPLVLLYMVTGFVQSGQYGFDGLMSLQVANALHQTFVWPLVVLFLLHAATTIYFALRRWGWIGKRACK